MLKKTINSCVLLAVLAIPGSIRTAEAPQAEKVEVPAPWGCMAIPEIPDHPEIYPNACVFDSRGVTCCRYDREECSYTICRAGCAPEWDLHSTICGGDRLKSLPKEELTL